MTTFYNTLKIEHGICGPDCSACEESCAREKGERACEWGRIRVIHLPEANFHGAMTCIQCSDPACRGVCPTGAITKTKADGVVRIDHERCVGCGLCTLACPYGGIYYNRQSAKAYKCDTCNGEPKCVPACKYKVLSFLQTGLISQQLGFTDIMGSGVSMCSGCGAELALRIAMKVFGENTILFGAPGCGAIGVYDCNVPTVSCLLTNVAPMMEGVKRYLKQQAVDAEVVAFVGDGATADVGLQSLSGAAERGEKLIYICYDNEAYMNTGIQRSSTTPYGAWTTTTPVSQSAQGKKQSGKYIPLIMAMHGIPYTATATVALIEDYIKKLEKAKAVQQGMAYIHVLAPCPTGWRASPDATIELSQRAVETNYFPLWECENGIFRFTHREENPRPIQHFTALMGRFSHLKEKDLEALQRLINYRLSLIEKLAKPS